MTDYARQAYAEPVRLHFAVPQYPDCFRVPHLIRVTC